MFILMYLAAKSRGEFVRQFATQSWPTCRGIAASKFQMPPLFPISQGRHFNRPAQRVRPLQCDPDEPGEPECLEFTVGETALGAHRNLSSIRSCNTMREIRQTCSRALGQTPPRYPHSHPMRRYKTRPYPRSSILGSALRTIFKSLSPRQPGIPLQVLALHGVPIMERLPITPT